MRSSFFAGAVLSLVACDPSNDAQFRYASCSLGCDITTPMMLGDEEDVIVTGSIPDKVSVESSAPSIVLVKAASRSCCPTNDAGSTLCHTVALNDACASKETASLVVTVHAPAEGTSDLLIKKSDSVWGSVAVSVEKAASLALACNTQGSVTLAQFDACPITWRATDANGIGLMSTAGIFLSSDSAVVTFDGLLELNKGDIQASAFPPGEVSMFAHSPGDATVTAIGGGASEVLLVHVTP